MWYPSCEVKRNLSPKKVAIENPLQLEKGKKKKERFRSEKFHRSFYVSKNQNILSLSPIITFQSHPTFSFHYRHERIFMEAELFSIRIENHTKNS